MTIRVFDLRLTQLDMMALDGAIDFYLQECAEREKVGDRSLSDQKVRLMAIKIRQRTEVSIAD